MGTEKKKHRAGRPATEDKKPSGIKDAQIVEQVWKLAEPVCDSEGMELVHVEYQRESSGRILRIYIDKPGGVKLDDCSRISQQMGDLLDVYLQTRGPYGLEVSSPGPDRPLGKQSDFERFKGCEARIKTVHPHDGQRNFRGTLQGVSQGQVKLLMDTKTVAISFQEIQKARLINFNGEDPCLSQI